MNPDNIHIFMFYHTHERYDDIKKRFGLGSNEQVDALHDYLTDSIEFFLCQDCTYNAVAYAQLFQRTLSQSWQQLNATLPLELVSRQIAYFTDQEGYPDCESFVNQIYQNLTKSIQLCEDYEMTNPATVKFYINATWYGKNTTYYETFKNQTGFTDDEIETFFDPIIKNSFGNEIAEVNILNAN